MKCLFKANQLICIIIFLLLVLSTGPLIAEAESETITALYPLAGKGAPAKLVKRINRQLSRSFLKLGEVKVITSGKHKKLSLCRTGACARRKGKEAGALYVVTGRITVKEKKLKYRKGHEGYNRYLVGVATKNRIYLTLEVYDTEKDKLVKRIDVSGFEGNIQGLVKKVVTRADSFLVQRKETSYKDDSKSTFTLSLNVSPAALVPLGSFSHLAMPGPGLSFGLGFHDLPAENMLFMIAGGAWYLQGRDSVRYVTTGRAAFLLGYRFSLWRSFSLAPLGGGGYHFHALNKETTKTYYDPLVTFQCELTWQPGSNLLFTFSPSYSLFFEEKETGMYLLFEAGARILF